jgi:hypothetical protein
MPSGGMVRCKNPLPQAKKVSEIALTKLVSIYVRILLYDRILHH